MYMDMRMHVHGRSTWHGQWRREGAKWARAEGRHHRVAMHVPWSMCHGRLCRALMYEREMFGRWVVSSEL